MHIKSKKEFEKLSAYSKGFHVYMLGEQKDEPFVPKKYPYKNLSDKDKKAYLNGEHQAMIIAQDDL